MRSNCTKAEFCREKLKQQWRRKKRQEGKMDRTSGVPGDFQFLLPGPQVGRPQIEGIYPLNPFSSSLSPRGLKPSWLRRSPGLSHPVTRPQAPSPSAVHGGPLRSRAGHLVHNVLSNSKSRPVNSSDTVGKVFAPPWSFPRITSDLCLHRAPVYVIHYTFLLHCFQGCRCLWITNPDQPVPDAAAGTA